MQFTQDPNTTIHARIESNKMALAACLPLPHLPSLDAAVQRLTPLAVVGGVPEKADLEMALLAVHQAKEKLARHNTLKAEADALQRELAAFEDEQRRARVQSANKSYQNAIDEYNNAGLALCRAYRRVLEQARRTESIPGGRAPLPRDFDFQPAMPHGWDGTVAYVMRNGLLPFEEAERRARQAELASGFPA